jgi:hypothetical protein
MHNRVIYQVTTRDVQLLDQLFQLCQQSHDHIHLYQTRTDLFTVNWVLDCDRSHRYHTLILLQYSQHLINLMGTHYI